MHDGEEKYIKGFGGAGYRIDTIMDKEGVVGIIILKWFLRKQNGMTWTGLIWLRIGKGNGLL
jgi:hypothetical protein